MPSSTKSSCSAKVSSSSHQALESCVEKAIIECKKHQCRRKWEKLANKLIDENLVVSQCEFDANRKYDTLCGFRFNEVANMVYNEDTLSPTSLAPVAIPSLAALREIDHKKQALLYVYTTTSANINNELTGNFVPLLDDILNLKYLPITAIPAVVYGTSSLNEFEDALYTSDDKIMHDRRATAEYIEQQEHVLAQIVEQFPTNALGDDYNIVYQNVNYKVNGKDMTAVVGMSNVDEDNNVVIFWYAYESC